MVFKCSGSGDPGSGAPLHICRIMSSCAEMSWSMDTREPGEDSVGWRIWWGSARVWRHRRRCILPNIQETQGGGDLAILRKRQGRWPESIKANISVGLGWWRRLCQRRYSSSSAVRHRGDVRCFISFSVRSRDSCRNWEGVRGTTATSSSSEKRINSLVVERLPSSGESWRQMS